MADMNDASTPDVPDLPAYAGEADRGLRDSLPAGDQMLGDAADVVDAECAKLENLLGVTVGLLDDGDLTAVQQRWYGIVRELLEFEAALTRVVTPALPNTGTGEPEDLLVDLRRYDGMTADIEPGDVRHVCVRAAQVVQRQHAELVPALRQLDDRTRQDLGEDLREVMG